MIADPVSNGHGEALPLPPNREPTLGDYVGILGRRVAVITIAGLLTIGTAVGFSLGRPQVYRATTTIVADRPVGIVAFFPDAISQGESYIDTLAEIIRSRAVAERAATRRGFVGSTSQAEASAIQDGLRVQRTRFTDMIRIDADGGTPGAATSRADAVAQAFIDLSLDARRAEASAARRFIEEQLRVASRDLRRAEEAMARFKVEGGNVSLTEEATLKLNRLTDFEAQLAAVQVERRAVEAQLARARAELQRLTRVTPATWTVSPAIASLRQQLVSLEVEIAGLLRLFTERHPQVQATRARIEETKARLAQELAKNLAPQTFTVDPLYENLAQQTVQGEVTRYALVAREGALRRSIDEWAADIRNLPPRELALARLTREQNVAEQVYIFLSNKYQEASIAEASVVPDVRVIDRAAAPAAPVEPDMRRTGLLAGVLGLLFGVVAAFGVESLDHTLRTAEDAERLLGIPLLGLIPRTHQIAPVRQNGRRWGRGIPLLTRMDPQSPFAEAYRTLRTNLLYVAPEGEVKTLLVTGAGRRDGRTTTAANLAVSFSRLKGVRVALVECDLRRPRLEAIFGRRALTGLGDHLLGEWPLTHRGVAADVLHPSGLEGLDLVPAGRVPPNPAELLASVKFREILGQLRQSHDIVILDTPAVLAVADASVASRNVDGVILVVRAGSTPRAEALRAKRQLEAVGTRLLGFVFNETPSPRRKFTYSITRAGRGSS